MHLSTWTPLIRLSNLFPQRQVYAKCEFLAPSGSFKMRGAVHLLDHLSRAGHTRQLVVPSMGNTALAAAVGAREFGFTVTGVVPQTISRAKDEKLRGLGVELIKVASAGGGEVLQTAKLLAQERGAYFVHPHLDPLWTDGYQAIVAEILQDLPGCRTLVFPVGGGGLLMGLTEYVLEHPAPLKLVGCEAHNYPTYARYSHERSPTIADGLVLDEPHPKVQQRIEALSLPIALMTEPEIRAAMADLYARHALVVEPSSAITIAFVKSHLDEVAEPICVIPTGENIARNDLHQLIAAPI